MEISQGVSKPISSLENRNFPGSDGFRKPDLRIDISTMTACLSQIFSGFLEMRKTLYTVKVGACDPYS